MYDSSISNQFLGSGGNVANMTGVEKFGDPFLLPSWQVMPDNLRSLFDVCRFLYIRCPEFAQAGKKLMSYFITDVEFGETKSGDKNEQIELKEWLHDQVGAFTHQYALGLDWTCYGNAFGRIHRPFNRFLVIPTDNGHAEVSVSEFDNATYNFSTVTYSIDDPTRSHRGGKHRRRISVPFIDRVARDLNRISLQRIDPAYVHLQYSDRSGRCQVVERFAPHLLASIKRGDLFNVSDMPISQLKAIADNCDFLYDEHEVFHLKSPEISGISNAGWGMPSILANFPNLHQLSVYRRIDEAIGLDYMMPMRVLFPNAGGNGGTLDAFANQGSTAVWHEAMQRMIKNSRKDPFAIHASPFPIGYEEVGGQGKTFAPKDSIAWQLDAMLNAQGMPAEMYHGSMAFQQLPGALRLFENQWRFLLSATSKHLQWVCGNMQDFMGRERIKVKAAAPRMIDDIESRHIMLQLAAGGEVPREVAFRGFGISNPVAAAVARAREDTEIEAQVGKIKTDAANAANGAFSGAQAGPGGAPGGVSYTPTQRAQEASAHAQEFLQIPLDGDRAKRMRELQQTDPDMHALVKQKMDEMRSAARSSGGQQVAQLAAAA